MDNSLGHVGRNADIGIPNLGLLVKLIFTLFLFLSNHVFAQDAFFLKPDIALHAVIEADFSRLKKFPSELFNNVYSKDYEVPAILILYKKLNDWSDDIKETARFNIGLRPRGLTRNFDCEEMPPYKIIFNKEQIKGTLFEGASKKMKFVSYCKTWANEDVADHDSQSAQKLAREYYTYRYLNIMGLPSFRTRLLKINYKDQKTKLETGWTFAFALESKSALANRLGMNKLEVNIAKCSNNDETCNYMNQKFAKADKQSEILKKLFIDKRQEWLFMEAKADIVLNVLNVSRDHLFGGNNSVILYKINQNGDKVYTIVPYDFDRNQQVSIDFNLFKNISKKYVTTGNDVKSYENYDSLVDYFKVTVNRLKKVIDFTNESSQERTLSNNYNIYNNYSAYEKLILQLEKFKSLYLEDIIKNE